MSKTTFQIPMCVLVPVLSARLGVCVCVRRMENGSEEECGVTNICEKMGRGDLVLFFLMCPLVSVTTRVPSFIFISPTSCRWLGTALIGWPGTTRKWRTEPEPQHRWTSLQQPGQDVDL